MVNTFVFMGRPGAGKGVQSALLSQKIGLPVFSTGDKVCAVSKADHALGKKIRSVQEAGGLTPHWFAAFLFQEALFNEGSKGMIFEGMGRKLPEAELFHEVHEWLGNDYRILYLEASPETVTERLVKRGKEQGRADDVPERIAVRLENFEKETRAAIDYFRSLGKVIDIDGEPSPEEVSAAILKEIGYAPL